MSDPILFEALPAATPAYGAGVLPALRGSGRQTLEGAVGAARLPALTGFGRRPNAGAATLPALRGAGFSVAANRGMGRLPALTGYGSTIVTVPDIVYGYAQIPPGGLRGTGVATLANHGAGAGTLPMLRGLGTAGATVGRGTLPALTGTGYARVFEPGAAINIFQNPGYLWMPAGNPRTVITERIALTGTPLDRAIHRLVERLTVTGTPGSVLEGLSAIHEHVEFIDRIAVVWKMLLADTVGIGDAATPSATAMHRLVEALSLVAGPGSSIEARNLVAETLALNDAIAVTAKEQLGDTAEFGEALRSALRARMRLLDELLVADVAAGSARVLGVLEETLHLDGTPATMLAALNRLQETIGFSVTLRIGDDTYVAWVVNTETRAAWKYDNFPFNSFCEFEGRYYGAAADGVYRLEGDDDQGEDIRARIRLGMSNFGISKEKRIPSLYLAYAADGRMVLKAVVTEIDGSRTEWWYGLTPRGAGGVREGRIQLGRGLKAAFWDFEISNLDGADFELAGLEFLPMVLDRKVRGRDG